MGNSWGRALRVSIFGESHGEAIGGILDGLPAGEAISLESIQSDMLRRAPGRDSHSTRRQESDNVHIVSGLHNSITTGFPLCGIIYNEDIRSQDYDLKLRPGHADWTALLKYGGHADMRGGGHFSGRLTAPLVFAGAIAKQILARRGVSVYARIAAIGNEQDCAAPYKRACFHDIAARPFPVYSDEAARRMRARIAHVQEEGDSIGGIVEAAAFGVPGGLGDPFFCSMESELAAMLFCVPAVKAVEFGEGVRFASMLGSEANDALHMEADAICASSNHNGGILGGITNGQPLVLRTTIKPTPSIAKAQHTVDVARMQNAILAINGRHDPCIVPRAVPVVEACVALCILDAMLYAGRC